MIYHKPSEQEMRDMLERIHIVYTKQQIYYKIEHTKIKLTTQQISDMHKQPDIRVQEMLDRIITIPTKQQTLDMQNNINTTPSEQQVKYMQERIGIKQTGNFDDTKKTLDEVMRLQPKIAHKILGMTKDDYHLFGLEPSDNL